jgi:hypothetical protein
MGVTVCIISCMTVRRFDAAPLHVLDIASNFGSLLTRISTALFRFDLQPKLFLDHTEDCLDALTVRLQFA